MLGGEQGLAKGKYRRTPLEDLLPVYLDAASDGGLPGAETYDLELTREGWLEPWVRLRASEALERARLDSMPDFHALNRVDGVKPGAAVLMQARSASGAERPALVAHRFGHGRSAALLVGDLWRWDMQRPDPLASDLGAAWRQLLRWLVADVPPRVALEAERDSGRGDVTLRAVVRDAAFEAVHNADVSLTVEGPERGEREEREVRAEPSAEAPGTWLAPFRPRAAGPYRARFAARAEDGRPLGAGPSDQVYAGWVHEPATAEFRSLAPDIEGLEALAQRTGGSLLEPSGLVAFVEKLVHEDVPITEEELDPLWHRWWVLALALLCLCTEWGLRRFRGLP